MNAKLIHKLKKSLPTILKVILGIITILYVWFVYFKTPTIQTADTETSVVKQILSYSEWFGGNKAMGKQVMKSLTSLIVVGFLITAVFYGTKWKEWNKFFLVVGTSFLLSVAYLIFYTGSFDFIKLVNNTLSGCIGYGLYRLFQNLLDTIRKKWKGTLPRRRVLSGWLCILIGLLCLLNGADVRYTKTTVDTADKTSEVQIDSTGKNNTSATNSNTYSESTTNLVSDYSPHEAVAQSIASDRYDTNTILSEAYRWEFVFQLDSVEEVEDELVLKGFAFILGKDSEYYEQFKPEIVLRKAGSNNRVIIDTEYGQKRKDVNQYFLCEYDYSNCGFTATVPTSQVDKEEEYEVLIRFGNSGTATTSTFITGTDIHYASEDTFKAPDTDMTDLDTIVKQGKLRVYRPDQYCWVYQYDGCLYWIVEDGFMFDKTGYTNLPLHKSGYTHIPYHLRTTQRDRIPGNSNKDNDMHNDDIFFEEQEITKEIDCGIYRVMKEKITTDYSISCIKIGVYIRLTWMWEQNFWPYYEF